jgi:cell division protease FtsH
MKSNIKLAIFCAVLVCVAGVFWMVMDKQRPLTTLSYSQFLGQVRAGHVASAVVIGSNSGATQATCRLKDGNTVLTVLPADYRDAMAEMQDNAVNVEIRDSSSSLVRFLINAAPFLVLVGLWIFLMNRLPNGPRPIFPG